MAILPIFSVFLFTGFTECRNLIRLRLDLRRHRPLNIVHVVADQTKTVAEAIDDIVIVSRARDDYA